MRNVRTWPSQVRTLRRPASRCHPMRHRPVLDLDDDAELDNAARDAADLALDAAERDAAARSAGRR